MSLKDRQIGLGLERLGLFPLNHPIISFILFVAISAACVVGIQRLKVEDSLSELFRSNTAEFLQYESLTQQFPSSEFDVLVVVEGEKLLTRSSLDAIRSMIIELQFVDGMTGLVSMFSARQPPEEGEIPPPLFPDEFPEGVEFEQLLERIRSNEIIKGKLLSDSGDLALVVIALDHKVVSSKGLRKVVGEIQGIVDAELKDTGLIAQLSGAPVMQLEIRNAVERDRLIYNGLGFLIGALIAILFFRQFSMMVIAAAPPAIAILWSLGILGWMDFRLNLFLNIMSPLIMVMGFSDTMQITFAMRDRLLAGDDKRTAIRYAILTVGPACVVTVMTAAASFITLLFSSSALIRTFGAAGALSTLIAYVSVIGLMPLFAMILLRDNSKIATGSMRQDRAVNWLRSICGWIADKIIGRPIYYSVLGIGLVIAFGYAHLTLEPRYRLADQVPDREQAIEASNRLDTKLTGANPIHVLIELPNEMELYTEDALSIIKTVHTNVENQEGFGNVWSVYTLQKWLEEANKPGIPVLQQYVDLLPEHLTSRFIAGSQKAVVVTGRIPDIDSSRISPLIDQLDQKLEKVRKQFPEVKISVTGLSAIAARNSGSMIEQLNFGLTAEMVFVAMLIGIAFRSVMIAFICIMPGLFPIIASGTLLAFTGEGLQFASIVALIVAFGLGLDATIHYLNRLRLEDDPNEDPAIGIKRATVLVGPALILTTIVLACGLAVTMFSDLPSLRLFGRLCAVTLVAALVGDLLILPATLLLVRKIERRFKKRTVPGAA